MMKNEEIKQKLKAFAKRHKKTSKVLLLLAMLISISLISMLVLYLFGVIYFDDGMQIHHELFDAFVNDWYGFIIVIVAQVIITSLLSFVPGTSMAFIILVQSLYEDLNLAFSVAFGGVMLSSLVMYIIGRFGGYNLGKWLIGEEECNKASELLNTKGLIYFPLMMMFPVFPDDALVMVAGTLKMSLKWFIPSVVLGRGIGVATIVYGLSIVPFEKFTTVWHWIGFILLCIVLLALVFFLATKFNQYIHRKNKKKKQNK